MKYNVSIDKDPLDEILQERIELHYREHRKGIELSELRKEYPELGEVPYSTLWHRVNSLAANDYIHVERGRRKLICYPNESEGSGPWPKN